MKLPIFQVDAFTGHLFGGNPAAVCPLDQWIPDEKMQSIAMENNLSETAFFVPFEDHFHIRWFTPVHEVDLCGHATLATSHVLFNHLGWNKPEIRYESRSGILIVRKETNRMTLDFPVDILHKVETPPLLEKYLGVKAVETFMGKTDYMVVVRTQKEVEGIVPDQKGLAEFPVRGVIVTARGEECDFVSRFFGPQSGVPEDPVTGSAHTTLTPYWSEKLGKTDMEAIQLSKRRGYLHCNVKGSRIEISGNAVTYMAGEIGI
jgi:PhzF family phenazine biosynthesis protein